METTCLTLDDDDEKTNSTLSVVENINSLGNNQMDVAFYDVDPCGEDTHASVGLSGPTDFDLDRTVVSESLEEYYRITLSENLDIGELPVFCQNANGVLHFDRFGSGAKGRCIVVDSGEWLTPRDFEEYAGRGQSKDWKKSIKFADKAAPKGSINLGILIENNILMLHPLSCVCEACKDVQESASRPHRVEKTRKRKGSYSYGENIQLKSIISRTSQLVGRSSQNSDITTNGRHYSSNPEMWEQLASVTSSIQDQLNDLQRKVSSLQKMIQSNLPANSQHRYQIVTTQTLHPQLSPQVKCQVCGTRANYACAECLTRYYCGTKCVMLDSADHRRCCAAPMGQVAVE